MEEEKIVDVYDISYEGAGVGRFDGKIVFIPKTLVGEKVSFQIARETSSFSIGKVKKIVEKSPKRIAPFCPYFSICGGCAFLHTDEENEKQIKIDILKKELAKVGYSKEVGFVSSDKRFGYRNKMKFEVENEKLGYFKPKTRDFFEVELCPIADDDFNVLLPKVKKFISGNDFLKLKNVYFKKIDKKIAIVFLFDKSAKIKLKKVKDLNLLNGNSVFFAYGEILESNNTKVFNVLGDEKLKKHVDDFEIEQDVSAFNQVNDFVAEKLYEYVVEKCDKLRVVNAYSGQGLLTYLLAKKAKFVYGIEYQNSAHVVAERLTSKLKEYKALNICGKVEDKIGDVFFRDAVNAVVLDPAREGCQRVVLEEILKTFAEKVVYVSCNFPTLVRDLDVLSQKYEIEEVKIFDMFPGCCAMETVVCLKRRV